MKKHPTQVTVFCGTLKDLAHELAKLRYDKIAEFMSHLELEIQDQAESDLSRGREKLSRTLFVIRNKVRIIGGVFREAFELCRPFMKEELKEEE